MPSPSLPYTLANAATADADQVMANFNALLNGIIDGTKDISVAALTVASTATFNGSVVLGNASSDDVTFTGSLASSIPVKVTNTYDLGSATLGFRRVYLGNAGGSTTLGIASTAAVGSSVVCTVPDPGANAEFVMTQGNATIAGTKTFSGQLIGKGTTTNDDPASGYIGQFVTTQVTRAGRVNLSGSGSSQDIVSMVIPAGDWLVGGTYGINGDACTQQLAWINSGASAVPSDYRLIKVFSGSGAAIAAGDDCVQDLPQQRLSLATQATHYMGMRIAYTGGMTGFGSIWALRTR